MLPDFPTIKESRFQTLRFRAYEAELDRHGFLSKLPAHAVEEGHDWRMKTVDGYHDGGGFRRLSSSGTLDTRLMPHLDDEKWIEVLRREMMAPIVDQQVAMFFELLDEVTASTGNVIDNSGRPLDEAVLHALAAMPLPFDDSGTPQYPSLLVGRSMFDRIRAMEPSDDFKQRHEQLVELKRIEWRLEQIDRRLVE